MRIALLGCGSVGRGVATVIQEKGLDFTITGMADSRSAVIDPDGINIQAMLTKKRDTGLCGDRALTAEDVVNQGEYDVLVEVTPTNALSGEPALTHIRTALERGRHVVTSNKGPVALAFSELKQMAQAAGVEFRYEATVGGAIPILHTLEHGLGGNTIQGLYGILNGTCNYILTRMADEGLTYDQALLEARELGYAEADPTYDVKGIDAAIKLVILADTIWGMHATLDDVEVTGIDMLTADALRLAATQDCTIRLIGEVVPEPKVLRVAPRMIPANHPLVIEGTLNAVTLRTDMAGEITLIGKGAGSIETASAIIGDLTYIAERYVKGA